MNAAFVDLTDASLESKKRAQEGLLDDELSGKGLVERLCSDFDAWAISLKETSLRSVLHLCPTQAKVGVWVKTPGYGIGPSAAKNSQTWEPVIFMTMAGRKRAPTMEPWCDHLVEPSLTDKSLRWTRPAGFSAWVFEGLGLKQRDTFVHLFQRNDTMTTAWRQWQRRNNPDGFQLEFFHEPTPKADF